MRANLLVLLLGIGACQDNGLNANTHNSCRTDRGTAALSGTGFSLQNFTPPCNPGGGAVLVSASGEVLALTGFQFPPADPSGTYMVDGWNVVLSEYITVLDHVVLWDNPNVVPTDQSQHGAVVAHAEGPWAVDLHKGGPLAGKGGGGEQATPVTVITNTDNGSPFDPAVTYGFGFSTVAAPSSGAYNVNLDSSEADDYAYMVANGYSVLYVGTATWAGGAGNPLGPCTQTNVNAGAIARPGDGGSEAGTAASVASGYDFTLMPPTLQFRMGFSTPTDYVNCQNGTDFMGIPGVAGEDHPRGVQVATQAVVAQVTIHMDHPFWESFAENSPLHWDQVAAQYAGASGIPVVHTEDMKGVSFLGFTDSSGAALPWRNCSGQNYTPPGNGQMNFDPLTVPVDPNATDPSKALRDYFDYMRYTQATQGHLNSQGLCFIARRYAAPGGGG